MIAHALAPIWEANHVWLILLIVLLWICFPPVYSAVSTALHIPLLIMLLGIVLRGTAFVFRAYGGGSEREQRSWGLLFSSTSVITPLMLGVVLGATATGTIEIDPRTGAVQTDFISDWLAFFPFVTGLFVLAVFAFLAAAYLMVETDDEVLREDFRRRALWAGGAVALLAILTTIVAADGAPPLFAGLFHAWWSIPAQLITVTTALIALVLIWRRRYWGGRLLAAVHVAAIVLDWALAIYPWMIPEQLSIEQAAAPANVLWTTLVVMLFGTPILAPSLFYLYRVFKRDTFKPSR